MLRVHVLGELELESDGVPLAPPASRRARALLAYLALNPGPHPRSALAARFWPDVLDESARTSLRGALADVRRVVGAELVATRETAGLHEPWTDAAAFAALVGEGRDEEALALCRGELLTGLDDDWIVALRDEHRDAQGVLLARLAAAADPATALRHTRARVALDPLSEDAHRDLMTRLAAAGDRAAALAVYKRLADRLRGELRIAPSAATRELAESLRVTAPAPPPLPRALDPRRARSPFVGRVAQLEQLRAAAASEERRLLAISGDPGIGKTRLLAELARAAYADGATVLYGRSPEEAVAAYQPFAEALRPVASADSGLAPLFGETAPGDAPGARLRLFEAVAAALAEMPGRPVLLALDDLHWADLPSLRLLAHVLRDTRPARVVVVATYRETELGRGHPLARALADLRRDRLVERVALSGLDGDAASGLIAGWVGADASAGLVGAVHDETGGNPFFIEEVLRHLLESGALELDGGRWQLARPVRELGVPESVREVIGRRLDRLGDTAVEVLETAAIIGPEFDLALLEPACAEPRDAILDALESAADANLIRALPDRSAGWAFSHALIREALHDELSGLRRTRLHARVAEGLDALPEPRPAELAHHGVEAAALVGADRAAGWARAAGDAAMRRLAYEEAAGHYAQAIDVVGERPALLLALADALVRAGDPGADVACEQAVAAARAAGDPDLLGRAVLASCGLGVSIVGLDGKRVALLEEALAAVGDPALRARLLARLAIALYYAPGRSRSGPLSAEAVAAAREAGDPDALLAALNARHVGLWHPSGLAERFAVADEMIALAIARDRPEAELQGRNWRCVDLWEAGDLEGFEAEAAEHERLADELRLPGFRWYAPIWRAAVAALQGRRDEAARLAQEAGAMAERAGDPNGPLFRDMIGFQLCVHAREFPDWLLEFAEDAVATYAAGMAYASSCAWMYAARGRDEDARAMLDRVAADDFADLSWDANWISALGELAEATALLGDRERAAELYDRLLPYADRRLVAGRAVCDEGSAHYALARFATTLGRDDEAAAHFEAALVSDAALGARPALIQTRARYAELLAARGDAERAAELAAAAVADARALGIPDAVPPGAAALAVVRAA
jgi:DNA-binding SARP family transcriptional activator/tetratricopeptide (TPR) repeat protein